MRGDGQDGQEEYEIVPIGAEYFIDSSEDPLGVQNPLDADYQASGASQTGLVPSEHHLIREPEKEEPDAGLNDQLELKPLRKRNVHTALRQNNDDKRLAMPEHFIDKNIARGSSSKMLQMESTNNQTSQ